RARSQRQGGEEQIDRTRERRSVTHETDASRKSVRPLQRRGGPCGGTLHSSRRRLGHSLRTCAIDGECFSRAPSLRIVRQCVHPPSARCNAIRKRLFEMVTGDPSRKQSAFALLGQIEVWRLEHGHPADEPRHPAIESEVSWPPLP